MIKIAALALAMISAPSVAQQSSGEYVDVGNGWELSRGDSRCFIIATYRGDVSLVISYDDRLNTSVVMFSDPSVKSLKDGDKRKIKTLFTGGGIYDDGWGEKDFTVSLLNRTTYFSRPFDGDIFLKDVSRYPTMSFWYGDVLLISLKLTGSSAAIAALRRCAKEQAKINPSDPFE